MWRVITRRNERRRFNEIIQEKGNKKMTLALVFAASLQPGGILAWLIVGLIAGFLAGKVMSGGGYGVVGDIVVGIVGAFLGGLIANLLFPSASFGLIGSIIVAFLGACVLVAILHAVTRTGRRRR
jgi:uncharacterized membrane protein YeaQ/YmgE (transglycosylase-associated protein family)